MVKPEALRRLTEATSESPKAETRKPYVAPRLTRHGRLEKITGLTSIGSQGASK
jgi:hypothetical protein